MSAGTSPPASPLERALELLLYAPVGLALTVAQDLPALAEKGRRRLGGQVQTARVVGHVALSQLERRLDGALGGEGAPSGPRPAGRPRRAWSDGATRSGGGASWTGEGPAGAAGGSTRSTARSARPPAPDGPEAGSLAIPGYNALSASQVVQRLPGLTSAELAAVREYEQLTRRRRTILARVDQLLVERPEGPSGPSRGRPEGPSDS
ncbi:MAG: hypothetical protein ACRDYD_05125 [Acidimicrobiales bacterium]